MNLTKEEKTVRNILINVASKKQLIYYSDLCKTANLRLDMSIPADRGKIGEILGHISRYEHENGRPLISSVVVSRSMEQGDAFLTDHFSDLESRPIFFALDHCLSQLFQCFFYKLSIPTYYW